MKITPPEISDVSPLKWLIGENPSSDKAVYSSTFVPGFDSECEATFMAFNSSAELTDHQLGSLPHNSIEHCLKPRLIDYYMGLYGSILSYCLGIYGFFSRTAFRC